MLKDVYNVELVDRSFGSCGYNAAKKPRLDSSKTLLDNMGHLIPIYVLSDASKNRLFNGIIRRVNILFSIYGFYRKCLKIRIVLFLCNIHSCNYLLMAVFFY